MAFKAKNRGTEPVTTDPTEHEKDITQCLKDIRMAVVAAAIFLDEKASEKHRDCAHALLMSVADQFGTNWD
jgi:hypothetical protein